MESRHSPSWLLCAVVACAAFAPTSSASDSPPLERGPAQLADGVPLPEPELVRSAADGDEVLAPRSGDPHFLGFAGGKHYPPQAERLDPAIGGAVQGLGVDGRPENEIYAFIMLGKRLTAARLESLLALGVRPLGFQPHYAIRAAIPVAEIPNVAMNDAVRWVGLARPWQKLHPHLAERMAAGAADRHAVYINVVESDLGVESVPIVGPRSSAGGPGMAIEEGAADPAGRGFRSNGWMQRALAARGVEVGEFLPGPLAFRARLGAGQLDAVLELDFVQFVEADVRVAPHHDESMPLVLADYGRASSFDGNASQQVRAGIVDSGFDHAHSALDHIFWVQWAEVDPGTTGASSDLCGHGSHVAGTILADPDHPADWAHRGVVPDLATWQGGRFRIVKYLGDDCGGQSPALSSVVSHFRGTFVDQFGVASPAPNVINNSYGTPGSWFGTEANARTIDDEVYTQDQVYVFAAGNEGPAAGTIGLPAVAKNALSVGSVLDHKLGANDPPGSLSSGSSRGPCADGRWKPNLVAPGNEVTSVQANTTDGFVGKLGTSMAAPHVTGLVAQLAEQNPAMRADPARVLSLLQATALTRNDVLLTNENDVHLDRYGCGRINAGKMLNAGAADWTWLNWDVSPTYTLTSPTYEAADFVVPSGTRRLVVCMTYVEPASLSGASKALVHDWDLFVDQPPVDIVNGNTGEYSAQQSNVDNTEIRILDDPTPGVWRWKAYPTAVFTPIVAQAKMSVTVVLIGGDTTPAATLALEADDAYVRPGESVEINASVAVSSYVGSAIFLDSSVTPVAPSFTAASTTLLDGPVTNLLGNQHFGRDVLLGDILGSSARDATWSVYWSSEGVMDFSVTMEGENIASQTSGVSITVDGTDPSVVTNLSSTSHVPGTWSNVAKVQVTWNAATDNLAGVAGYSLLMTNGAPEAPDETIDTPGTAFSHSFASSPFGNFVNVRTGDLCNNWSNGFASAGPFLIDTLLPNDVTNLKSTTHGAGIWSKSASVTFAWTPAVDATSGIAGYSVLTSSGAPALPDTSADVGTVSTLTQTLVSSASPRFFNVRSVDKAGNWGLGSTNFGPLLIDTVAPGAPTNLASPSHSIGVPDTNPTLVVNWSAAVDTHSGTAGYATAFDQQPDTIPPGVVDTTLTTKSATLAPSTADWWAHVRAVDQAGNLGATAHLGPFRIDVCATPATSIGYGIGKPGTLGIPQLVAVDPPVLGGVTTVEIQFGLPGSLPILLLGAASTATPFEGGFLLVAPGLVLPLPAPLGATGSLALSGSLPLDAALCGSSFYLQALVPDPGAAGLHQLAMTPGLQLVLGS